MALPATENFAGAAGALGGSWTQQVTQTINKNGSGLGTTSGADATNGASCYWNADTFSAAQYAKIKFQSGAASSAYCGCSVRATDTGTTAADRYALLATGSGTSGQTQLIVTVNGAATTLANYAQAWSAGDEMYIEARASSILAKRNGTALGAAITNSTLTAGSAGIAAAQVAGTAPTFDDWEGGNLPRAYVFDKGSAFNRGAVFAGALR